MISKTFALFVLSLSATVSHAQLATVCANVNINLPSTTVAGINLLGLPLGGLCLCEDVASQSLTDSSVALLSSAITGAGLLGDVGAVLTDILEIVEPTGVTAVNDATSNCVFPTDAVSTCTDTACSFTCTGDCTCPTGTTLTPVGTTGSFRCSTLSPSARRRRSELHARSFGACPFAHSACAIPGSASSKTVARRGYECLDLTSNIESCGGCRYPLAGEVAGQDCTEILHTDTVSCVQSTCVIKSCLTGYSISSDGTACVPAFILQE